MKILESGLMFFLAGAIWLSGSCREMHADQPPPASGGQLTASLYASPHHLNPAIQSGLATAFPGAQMRKYLDTFQMDQIEKWLFDCLQRKER